MIMMLFVEVTYMPFLTIMSSKKEIEATAYRRQTSGLLAAKNIPTVVAAFQLYEAEFMAHPL